LLLLAVLAMPGCEQPAWVEREAPLRARVGVAPPEQDEIGPFPKVGLFTVATAGQTGSAGLADDPAIWVHPDDPSLSLVIGTNKNSSGGLHVFTLQGTQLQFVAGGRHNNVDIRYGFMLQGNAVDLVAACDRNNNQIDVYTINPSTRVLTPVGNIQTGITVYGFAMYHSRPTGRYFGIVSSSDGIEQWEFIANANGTVGGILVRTYASQSQVEGMVADDELGYLYLAEESNGIYKYSAEPGQSNARLATVDVAGSATQLIADIEGLTLYYRRDGRGYLVASSQGNDRFVVYRREGNNPYLGTFALSGVGDTDGIDVANIGLGPLYSQGLFVAQNRDTDFRTARWQDIANALGLAIDTSGYDVREGIGCSAAASVDLAPGSGVLDVGSTLQLQATAMDGGGDPLGGCVAAWSSSDAAIATVSSSGLVRGERRGLAIITATIEGASGETTIQVVAPVNRRPVTVTPVATPDDGNGRSD